MHANSQVVPSPVKPALQAHVWPRGVLKQSAVVVLQPPLLLPQRTIAEIA